jgi:hypothetical protein
MFDNLTSENWPDDKTMISCIFEAVGRQNLQVVVFKHMKEKVDGYPEDQQYDVCINYRYAARHDPLHFKQAEVLADSTKTKDKV